MGIMDYLKDSAGNFLKTAVYDQGHELIYKAKLELWRFQKRLIKSMISVFILLLAFSVLAMAGVFSLIEYAQFSKTLAFLIIGAVLLIIGIIVKI
jgi:hypothetical protein